MLRRRALVIIGAALVVTALIAIVVVAIVQQANPSAPSGNSNSQSQPNAPGGQPPTGEQPAPNPQEPADEQADESHNLVYIQNMDPLFTIFSSQQALYINDTVVNYTFDNYGRYRIYIANNQIQNRGGEAYGFNITNDNNEQLFYVIATKTTNGNVKVDFY